MKIPSLFLSTLLISQISVNAQHFPAFDQLTDEDGLSNGFVTSMYQDEKGFMWFGTANGLNRFDGYQVKSWTSDAHDTNSLSHSVIWTIFGTADGTIWIGTDKGLNRFDPKTESFTRYFGDPADEHSLSNDLIMAINEDQNDNLWVGTGNGLCILQKGSHKFIRFLYSSTQPVEKSVRSIVRDEDNLMWFGSMDTLYCANPATLQFQKFPLPDSVKTMDPTDSYIKAIFLEDPFNLWFSIGNNGICQFDKKKRLLIRHYKNDPKKAYSLGHNRISSFHKNDNGNLWIGTYGGGLNALSPDREHFYQFQVDPFNPVQYKFEVVRHIQKDKAGNVWLGTFYGGAKVDLKNKKPFIHYGPIPGKANSIGDGQIGQMTESTGGGIWVPVDGWGLALFDPQKETFSPIPIQTRQLKNSVNNIISALEDKSGDLWVLSFNDIWIRSHTTGKWKNLQPSGFIKDQWLVAQFIDSKGNHLIASQGGLSRYDVSTNTLVPIYLDATKINSTHGDNLHVESFFESADGGAWVATHGGLNHRPPGSDHFKFYPFHHQVLCIHEDKAGTIWLGTIGGLAFFDKQKKQVMIHPKATALVGKLAHAILGDKRGRLWISSRAGIFCFDPATGLTKEYNQKDGLVNKQFFAAHLESQAGEFYFGGSKGLLRFHPDSIHENSFVPPVVITNFLMLNKAVPIRGTKGDTLKRQSPLLQNIIYTDSLVLEHDQNDFTFEFAALDFTAPMNNKYRYKLEGYENSWIETDASRRFAHYTNLRPRKYTFKVMGSNNDGNWNERGASIFIRITPPLWYTWWAISVWVALSLGLLLLIRRNELGRVRTRKEAESLRELDAMKSRSYAEISHEFRTPLTVILGEIEEVQTKAATIDIQPEVDRIRRNGRQLLDLVNQILDLSKLESGAMKLHLEQLEVVHFLRYVLEAFHSLAEGKKITLHFKSEIPELYMDFDPQYLQQIVSNLFSNAIKFTLQAGRVDLLLSKQNRFLEIIVKDTGIGIPEDKLPHIFNRYYQVDDSHGAGSGIGLTLTKGLVELMGGTITVQSQLGKGTTFSVLLPVTQVHQKGTQPSIFNTSQISRPLPPPLASRTPVDNNAPLLLLVEDNLDVLSYLQSCLQSQYRVVVAYHGEEGIEKAIELVPDLIVSDVMMPQKDGFELCQTLKTDSRTSHIPIILLTAKADIESKLSGLKRGADAYLAKPFDKQELLTRIQNLLEIRKKLQTYYLLQVGMGEDGGGCWGCWGCC